MFCFWFFFFFFYGQGTRKERQAIELGLLESKCGRTCGQLQFPEEKWQKAKHCAWDLLAALKYEPKFTNIWVMGTISDPSYTTKGRRTAQEQLVGWKLSQMSFIWWEAKFAHKVKSCRVTTGPNLICGLIGSLLIYKRSGLWGNWN